jgi:uncharacterized surface protein with fasciclin (FAS1) repeats
MIFFTTIRLSFLTRGVKMRAMCRSSIAAIAVAGALTLTACGGSTDGATPVESSLASKGEAQAPKDQSVTVEEETDVTADNQGLSSNRVCPGIFSDVLECLESNGNFNSFLSALSDVQRDELSTGGPLTVFAPTDDAFEALGEEVLGQLGNDEDFRFEIINRHILDDVYLTPDFFSMDPNFIDVAKFSGVETDLDGVLYVEGAVVAPGDNIVDNGVIHVIDRVLVFQN